MNTNARQFRSQTTLTLLVLAALAMVAFLTWQSADSASRRLADAQNELAEATRMTSDIKRLKDAPRIASLEMESPDEISRRVSDSLQQLNSRTAKLLRLDPQQPKRIPKSDYQVRATDVELDNIRVSELAKFSAVLVQSAQGLEVRDINLSKSESGGSSTETWLAKLTLTQIIYSPR